MFHIPGVLLQAAAPAADPSVINGGGVLSIVMLMVIAAIGIGVYALTKGSSAHAATMTNSVKDEMRVELDGKLNNLQSNQRTKELEKEVEDLKDQSRDNTHLHQWHGNQTTYSPKV